MAKPDGDFTLVESPDASGHGLVVRRVSDADKRLVRRWGGFLFATEAEAQAFAQREMASGGSLSLGGPRAFSHKRVDGQRIYVQVGRSL